MNFPNKNQVLNVVTLMVILLFFIITIPILIKLEAPSLVKIICGVIVLSVPIILFKKIKSQLEEYIGILWDDKED